MDSEDKHQQPIIFESENQEHQLVPACIYSRSDIDGLEKILLAFILYTTVRGRGCLMSNENLAERFGATPRQVKRAIARLFELNMIWSNGSTRARVLRTYSKGDRIRSQKGPNQLTGLGPNSDLIEPTLGRENALIDPLLGRQNDHIKKSILNKRNIKKRGGEATDVHFRPDFLEVFGRYQIGDKVKSNLAWEGLSPEKKQEAYSVIAKIRYSVPAKMRKPLESFLSQDLYTEESSVLAHQ